MTRCRILCRTLTLMLMLIVAMCMVGVGIGAADEVNLTLAGHFGGPTNAVAVSGNYAYIGQGGDLVMLDMGSPDSPVELGRVMTSGTVYDVVVAGSYAYVADLTNGLVVVDISNPAAPTLAGSYDTAGYAWGVTVEGSYAYVADSCKGLVVVDISNPVAPILAGSYDIAGFVEDVTVAGSYAYVANVYDGLVVVDISNPAAPTLAGSYNTAGSARGVTVSGSYAYIADDNNGLVVVDISNPAAPTLASSYDTGDAHGVTIEGSYAYVADGGNGLVVVDINSPEAPTLAGSYDTAGCARGVTVEGSYAYVADLTNALVVLDISNPAAPNLAGSYNTAGLVYGVTVAGSYAYVADIDDLIVVNISNPAALTLAGSYNTAGSARGVTVAGSYAYVADGDNYLVVVNISNPAAPILAGSYNTAGSARGVTVEGSYAYVADGDNGLVVLDISNPAAPTLAGSYDTEGKAHGVTVEGSYAYVADGDNGLVVLDISNPAAPTLAGSYDTENAYGVTVAGSYAYVADYSNGLVIVDISNPAAPTLAGSYDTAGYALGVTVEGSYAYVANWVYGLVVLDISNPAAPTLAGSYDTENAHGVTVAGSYAYVADNTNGLVVVDISNPAAPTLAGSYDTAGFARGVVVEGSYVYVADLTNGFVILRMDASGTIPPEITRSRLGINTHWNHWAEDLSIYEQKTKNFGIVRDQAWWAGLETSDLTGSEWDHANWNYSYDTETLCGKEITYQSGLDNLVKLYQDEDSPELLLLLNLKNDNISSFETITADQYYDYVYHVVERYDRDGLDDMPGLIKPVSYFEVGNEVDYNINRTNDSRHGYLSPKDYVEKRLIPAYNAAKAANKDAVIMGSGLGMESNLSGGKTGEFNTAYLEAMYDNITANGGSKSNNFYMDKIAIHYYSQNEHPELFDENIKQVENVIMDKEGSEKPIWITEFAPASPPSLYARLLTLMFANRIEMPVIYNLKDDSEESFGLYDITCEGDEETITPRESIQVIDTLLSTLHGTTPSETENENISVEPGKTTYQRVFNNSDKKVTVLWYIDTADPGAVTNCVVFPESPQTFTVDVLGTAKFSQTSPINIEIGYEPTYVVEADLPIDVDLYFNRTTTAGVSTERAASFAVGDTLYGKIKTSTSTDHLVKTYITITMPDGTCRYAYYDKPDFTPGSERLLFSDKKVQLYDGVWHATTDDWLWNIYEFTEGDSGIYAWNCWYEDSETGEILGGNSTEYTFSTTPSGTPVDSSTGKGEIYLDSSAGNLENFIAISPDDMPAMPESLNPVYGFFSFNITGISGGQSVDIPLAFPNNVPIGTEYWKYGPTPDDITPHWYQIPVSDDDGDRIIVITLTDGGIGDDDLTANSVIIDDGGPSLPLRVHNIDTGENFPTIQTAIDDLNTQDGHTITVDAGTYVENVNVNKRVTLSGEGADMVTVRAADAEDDVFKVTANWVNISGFAVTGATGNYKAGIHLNNADRCSILENNVTDNDCGIFIGDSNNNTIYHNNLIDNTQNAYDSCTNQWNSGSEGNYYSDYGGIDADGDGIGDTPYNISGGSAAQDRYPLMDTWNESDSESISIGSANAPTNSTVTIPISVANVTNITGFSFDLIYNSSVATVSSVSANVNFTGASITPNIDNINGNTRVILTGSDLITVSSETPVIDIIFDIIGDLGSSTSLVLQNVEFNDSEFNPYVPDSIVNGNITVGVVGDFNNNGRVDIGDVAKVAFMVAGMVPEDLSADFNDNGYVDIGDAAKIAFYLAEKVDEL